MIEPPCKAIAFVDGQIELQLPAGAAGRARSGRKLHRWSIVAEVELARSARLHAGGAVEKPCELGQRDWPLVIEDTGRATPVQEPCGRRDRLRRHGREFAQLDCLAGP